MSDSPPAWFSVSRPGANHLPCGRCGFELRLGDIVGDHHPRHCPNCGAESVYVDLRDQTAQLLVEAAPPQMRRLIRWAQANLDELEFTELLCNLEELADALGTGRAGEKAAVSS
jgi:hypothetical protein